MNETLTMNKKKRKRANHNPLAHARTTHDKAELLWHKKSGAGYCLFAEYYAKQPGGVVCERLTADTQKVNSSDLNKSQDQKQQGNSRASKRRKKKKQKNPSQDGGDCTDVAGDSIHENEPTIDPRLAKVLADFQKNQPMTLFLSTLAKPLPLTFRIRRTVPSHQAVRLREKILQKFGHLVTQSTFDDCIYQAKTLSKNNLTKVSPELKEFLVNNSGNGRIARQELGSMLPVWALTRGGWLHAKSRVLDLCASPGSKTLQAMEIVKRVYANDVNASRLDSLRQAVARSGLGHDNNKIKYSQMDARLYPQNKLFDSIICDVPCSGDGTIRKDTHILCEWTPAVSHALHCLQVQILVRALQCLKLGSVMSYSTCSLNPVENEAVVAAAMNEMQSQTNKNGHEDSLAVELVPWPEIHGLQVRPGVSEWKIAELANGTTAQDDDQDDTLTWHAHYADAQSAQMEHAVPTMWPPSNAKQLHLDRCIRLWPQDNDSGGFFVALIKRNW